MNPLKLSVVCVLGLAACSTPPKPTPLAQKVVSQAKVRHDYLKPRDIERVRTDEFVKTYHIGRTVNGRGDSTMHEAHRVYRLEKPSRWNLARDQPPLASTGPVNRVVDSAFKPAPESAAVRAELNHQLELSAGLEQASDELTQMLGKAQRKLADSATSGGAVDQLERQVQALKAENTVLKRRQSISEASVNNSENPAPNALKNWGDNLESKAP
ncbi:MAG: hypothetical protein R3F19_12365 [Verrucomicrobiales bacterium]